MQPPFELPTPHDAPGTRSNGNSSAYSDWDYAKNDMPPSFKLPTANHAPRTRSNSNASAFSDWDIFEAMVRNDENPAPIDFSNVDLDELFQITRPRPPVANGPPAVCSSSSPVILLDILNHLLAIQDVEKLLYFKHVLRLTLHQLKRSNADKQPRSLPTSCTVLSHMGSLRRPLKYLSLIGTLFIRQSSF